MKFIPQMTSCLWLGLLPMTMADPRKHTPPNFVFILADDQGWNALSVRADPGNSTERLLIGFGAGRSALLTKASFDIAGQAGPAMSFSATAKDGRKTGLIGQLVVSIGLAIALRYDDAESDAPTVLAKGQEHLAERRRARS